MLKFSYLNIIILVIISACGEISKTKNKKSAQDTLIIDIKRFNKERGVQENYKIDKRDYEIIKHLDVLANKALYTHFRLNDQHRISHLSIDFLNEKNRSKNKEQFILKSLKLSLFENPKYNLAKLGGLKMLSLYINIDSLKVNFKFPASLNHLQGLDLSGSSVQSVVFAKKNQLSFLRLVSCNLNSLDSVMTNLHNLRTLFVMNNKIKNVNFDIKKYSKLEQVDLSGNPLLTPLDSLKKKYPRVKIFFNENQRFMESTQ